MGVHIRYLFSLFFVALFTHIVAIPESDFNAAAHKNLVTTLIVGIVIGVAGIVLNIVIARLITKPIQVLTESM